MTTTPSLLVLLTLTILNCCTPLPAQPPSRYAELAKIARDVSNIEKQGAQWQPFIASSSPTVKQAMEKDIAAFHAYAAASLKMAEAYELGAQPAIEAAQAKTRAAIETTRRTREAVQVLKLMEFFSGQIDDLAMPYHSPEFKALPEVKLFLKALQRGLDAGNKLASALDTNSSQAVLDDAHDEWDTARFEIFLISDDKDAAASLAIKSKTATEQKNAAVLAQIEELRKANAEVRLLRQHEHTLKMKLGKLQRQRDRIDASLNPPGPP